jgi:hypothetical protein
MDTRRKIVPHAPPGCDLVEGYFDPLLAPQAAALAARKGSAPLAVIIREPADPLLDARARAELIAALAAVDYVVIGGAERGKFLDQDRETFQRQIRAKHGR